jgi:hypothetical protein
MRHLSEHSGRLHPRLWLHAVRSRTGGCPEVADTTLTWLAKQKL